MIPATVQQLDVVSRKALKLEQQVTANIETLKAARTEKHDADAHLDAMREALRQAEERCDVATVQHERAEKSLRQAASEYSKAQLLQKKLANTLKELQGFNRAIVVTEGGAVHGNAEDHHHHGGNNGDGDVGGAVPSSDAPPPLRVADSCTVHAPSMRKTIVVDSVVCSTNATVSSASLADADHHSNGGGGGAASSVNHSALNSSSLPSSSSSSSFSNLMIPSMVGDALSGYNVSCITMGPKGAGKSTAMWGALRSSSGANMNARGSGAGGFSISPHNAKLSNAIADPSGFLLGKYFKGFEGYLGGGGGSASSPYAACPVAIVPLFMHHLFSQFGTYDVTHFNIRVSFVELVVDGMVDLFSVAAASGNRSASSAAAANPYYAGVGADASVMPIGFFGHSSNGNNDANTTHSISAAANMKGAHGASDAAQYLATQRAASLQVRSEEEFYEALRHAMANRHNRLAAHFQRQQNNHHTNNYRRTASTTSSSSNANAIDGGVPPTPPLHQLVELFGGHLAMTVCIENFNSRGNFRRSAVLFTDVAGGISASPSTSSSSANQQHSSPPTPEQQWAAKGAWALTDVISMASAAVTSAMTRQQQQQSQQHNTSVGVAPHNTQPSAVSAAAAAAAAHEVMGRVALPHQSNRLVQLVKEGFGGNAKSVLCCVIPPADRLSSPSSVVAAHSHHGSGDGSHDSAHHAQQLLAASLNVLAYAHYFKGTCHNAVPFDIPPELQQLTREAEEEEEEAAAMMMMGDHHSNGGVPLDGYYGQQQQQHQYGAAATADQHRYQQQQSQYAQYGHDGQQYYN